MGGSSSHSSRLAVRPCGTGSNVSRLRGPAAVEDMAAIVYGAPAPVTHASRPDRHR
jgi:hypothetical protein